MVERKKNKKKDGRRVCFLNTGGKIDDGWILFSFLVIGFTQLLSYWFDSSRLPGWDESRFHYITKRLVICSILENILTTPVFFTTTSKKGSHQVRKYSHTALRMHNLPDVPLARLSESMPLPVKIWICTWIELITSYFYFMQKFKKYTN